MCVEVAMQLILVRCGSVGLYLDIEILDLQSAHDFEDSAWLVEVVVHW